MNEVQRPWRSRRRSGIPLAAAGMYLPADACENPNREPGACKFIGLAAHVDFAPDSLRKLYHFQEVFVYFIE
jgi:hypothetical protein